MAFDGVLAGSFIVWAFASALRVRDGEDVRWLLATGVLGGMALVTRQSTVVMLPGLFALAYFRTPQRSRFAAAVLGLAPFAAWQLYYNWLRTGDPFMPAVMLQQYAVTNELEPGGVVTGLIGLLLSPGKSLFVYSPPLLLALYGWWRLGRARRQVALAVAAMVIPFVVLHASVRNWAGDWGWGPRYMTSVVPLLMLGLTPIVALAVDHGHRSWRQALLVVAAVGIAFQTLALAANWHFRYAYLAQTGGLALREMTWSVSSPQWLDAFGAVLTNLHRPWSAAAVPVVDGVHPYVQAGAASVNVWWVILWSSNAPKPLILMGVLGCIALCASGAWRLAPVLRERTAS
jgi:4-amino-4-deoxy-L-arabinose transferase-like glycosyltransferase